MWVNDKKLDTSFKAASSWPSAWHQPVHDKRQFYTLNRSHSSQRPISIRRNYYLSLPILPTLPASVEPTAWSPTLVSCAAKPSRWEVGARLNIQLALRLVEVNLDVKASIST